MSYVIKLYVSDIESINRVIMVNDSLSLQLFIKCLILSMNGDINVLNLLKNNDEIVEFEDTDCISLLNLKVGDTYQIIYNFDDKAWNLEFEVLKKNENLNVKKMEIIDGVEYGICQNENMFFIRELIDTKNKKWKDSVLNHYKTLSTYFNSKFLLEENNKLVNDYIILYEDMHTPKSVVMNISLDRFAKSIKRKIIVNNNILIDKFCRAIIVSMNGDMEHLYTIKVNKKWYDENILDEKLNYLDLSIGKKFKVIYDFGDNWEFNVKISKICPEYHTKEFEVLSGAGYGIIEDCGGAYELDNAFIDESNSFELCNINEFNLVEIQKLVEEELKIDNLHQERKSYYNNF